MPGRVRVYAQRPVGPHVVFCCRQDSCLRFRRRTWSRANGGLSGSVVSVLWLLVYMWICGFVRIAGWLIVILYVSAGVHNGGVESVAFRVFAR